jgi:hypothetical protein
LGVTRAKSRISRATGIPLTRGGRQRKIGSLLTGQGCMVWLLVAGVLVAVSW